MIIWIDKPLANIIRTDRLLANDHPMARPLVNDSPFPSPFSRSLQKIYFPSPNIFIFFLRRIIFLRKKTYFPCPNIFFSSLSGFLLLCKKYIFLLQIISSFPLSNCQTFFCRSKLYVCLVFLWFYITFLHQNDCELAGDVVDIFGLEKMGGWTTQVLILIMICFRT